MPDRTTIDEAALIRRAADGDRRAQNELARLWLGRLPGVARRMMSESLRAWIEPDDVTNQALADAFESFERFAPGDDPVAEFRRWVYAITRRRVLRAAEQHDKHLRASLGQLSEAITEDQVRAGGPTPSVQEQRAWSGSRLRAAVAELPEADRELVEWHHFCGVPLAQIETILRDRDGEKGKSVDALKQALSRAREKLRDPLGRPSAHDLPRLRTKRRKASDGTDRPDGDAAP